MLLALRTLLLVLVLGACVVARTEVTSFKDPAYSEKPQFSSVIVFTTGMALDEKTAVETAAVQAFSDRGARALRGMDVVPPTRQLGDAELIETVLATGVQTVLVVSAGGKGHEETYVPPALYVGQTFSTITGGYPISKPKAGYSAILIDTSTGSAVWQADALSRGKAFAEFSDLARSMAEKAVAKLYEDGVF